MIRLHQSRDRGLDGRVEEWAPLASDAKEIDLMGLTLWRHWFQQPELCEAMHRMINNGGTIRVMLLDKDKKLDPTSSIAVRIRQPGEGEDILTGLLTESYKALNTFTQDLASGISAVEEHLKIRLVSECLFYALVIRIDDYIFVAPYLSSALGEHSFALSIRGPRGTAYKIYMKELDEVFSHGYTPRWQGQGNKTEEL